MFRAYFCQLSAAQQHFGLVVAAREVLYLATTVAGILACPVYLLLDISTVWAEADTISDRFGHTAMYVLTPHVSLQKRNCFCAVKLSFCAVELLLIPSTGLTCRLQFRRTTWRFVSPPISVSAAPRQA